MNGKQHRPYSDPTECSIYLGLHYLLRPISPNNLGHYDILSICRFVRIQDKLRKAVSSLDFFTSHSWVFSTENLFMLHNKMTPEDRKVLLKFYFVIWASSS